MAIYLISLHQENYRFTHYQTFKVIEYDMLCHFLKIDENIKKLNKIYKDCMLFKIQPIYTSSEGNKINIPYMKIITYFYIE